MFAKATFSEVDSMKQIPIEFLPGFWVTVPEGLEKQGSGFLLAEGIRSVFSIGVTVPPSQDFSKSWSIVNISEEESRRDHYLSAFVLLATETWLETQSIIMVGPRECLYHILERFMIQTGGTDPKNARRVVKSKLG